MADLFISLFNMSITASWLVLAVVVLRFLLKKAPKWINTVLWAFVGIRLVCPISFESMLSLIPSTQTIPHNIVSGPSFDVNTGINIVDNQVNDYLGSHYFEGVTVPTDTGMTTISILSVLWLIGIIGMILYAVISFLRLHKKVREGVVLKDNIWLCDRIDTPFILGLFKPRIFLPSGIAESDMEYVIAHEKAHLRRRDHWWKPLGFFLLTVYWFNPVMWVAYVLLCRDIELACDEKVLKEMGADIKKSYSEALINCSVSRRTISACPLAFGETGVKGRIKSVLSYKKPTLWIIIIAVISCIIVAVCFLTNPKSELKDSIPESDFYGSPYGNKYDYLEKLDYTTAAKIVTEMSDRYAITAIHYPASGEVESGILIGEAYCNEAGDLLDKMNWKRSLPPLESLPSPGSVEFVIAEDYRVTIHKRKKSSVFAYAVVKYGEEERYYHASYNDYKDAVAILKPPSDITETITSGFNEYTYLTEYDSSVLHLNPVTKHVFFSLSLYSSYICQGRYTEDENEIVITAEDMKHQYTFRKDGNNLVFVADKSTAMPKYKYNGANTDPIVCIPDGAVFEHYGYSVGYIDKAYADIDGDGIKEDCILGYGPTSGLFTVTFSVYENGYLEYFNIFNCGLQDVSFGRDKDGKLIVEGPLLRYGEDPIDVHYDVIIKDGNIVLKGNVDLGSGDSIMSYWGEQGLSSPYAGS